MSIVYVPNPDEAALGRLGDFANRYFFDQLAQKRKDEEDAERARVLQEAMSAINQGRQGIQAQPDPTNVAQSGQMIGQQPSSPIMQYAPSQNTGWGSLAQSTAPPQNPGVYDIMNAMLGVDNAGKHIEALAPVAQALGSAKATDRNYFRSVDEWEKEFGLDKAKFGETKDYHDNIVGLREKEINLGKQELAHKIDTDWAKIKQAGAVAGIDMANTVNMRIFAQNKALETFQKFIDMGYDAQQAGQFTDDVMKTAGLNFSISDIGNPSTPNPDLKPGDQVKLSLDEAQKKVKNNEYLSNDQALALINDNRHIMESNPDFHDSNGKFSLDLAMNYYTGNDIAGQFLDALGVE
jgi:hypothetical protein